MDSITTTREWQHLVELRREWRGRRVIDCFRDDPQRAQRFSAEAAGIFLDYSRQRLDDAALDALIDLLHARDFTGALTALWRGDPVNHTEKRAALHMALRGEPGDGLGNGETEKFVEEQRQHMRDLVERVRSGEWLSPQGERYEHIIHVGIGGSHLGPALAVDVLDAALPDVAGPEIHFVSTTDPGALSRLMRRLPRERCLLVLVSKSFTTAETSLNAATLGEWLAGDVAVERVMREQVVGISANQAAMNAAGIPGEHQLLMPEWAGGRYSLWCGVGLPIALRFGMPAFEDLLAGARDMDANFRSAEPRQNLPLLLALVGVWNINFHDASSHAVLPYSEALAQLPAYLQQLEMESNGKQVDRAGKKIDYRTAPVVWGGVGMNGQHAFFQQLHQGTAWSPLDFILVGGPDHDLCAHQNAVLANGLAQADALMRGRDEETAQREGGDDVLIPHKIFPGNRPSSTILVEQLNARRLGALLAMYEHKVFAQSVIWNINPFDQFGVELGKQIAKEIEPLLSGDAEVGGDIDPATKQLLEKLKIDR